MAVYLDETEEARRRAELEEFDRERQEKIEEARINGKAKRKRQDKIFQKLLILVIVAVVVYLVIDWAMYAGV